MSDTPLRPRSITEIVDTAFTLYRRHVSQFVMVAAIAYAPYLLFIVLRGGDESADVMSNAMGSIVAAVVSMISFSLVTGVVHRLGSQAYLEGTVDVEGAVRATLPRVPALIGSAVLMAVAGTIGVLCLLVGALYVAARFFAVTPAIVLEGKSVFDAFSRSSQLSDGRKWPILGTLALVFGIYFLLGIGLSVVLISATLAGQAWIALVVNAIFTILAYPATALVTLVLYYDARIRTEGFDVEHLSSRLDQTAAAPVGGS